MLYVHYSLLLVSHLIIDMVSTAFGFDNDVLLVGETHLKIWGISHDIALFLKRCSCSLLVVMHDFGLKALL